MSKSLAKPVESLSTPSFANVPVRSTASDVVQRTFEIKVPAEYGDRWDLASLIGVPFVTTNALYNEDDHEIAVSFVSPEGSGYFVGRSLPIVKTMRKFYDETGTYEGLYAQYGLLPRVVDLKDKTKGVEGKGVSWRFATSPVTPERLDEWREHEDSRLTVLEAIPVLQ